ncbi:baseplate J/gp47 family protein [Bosea sp. 685]|uniref:baseplate J/gp47 family protein n=1 Tax=Bosea sp. 685 TaxID=3080057 RepID=UPI0028929CFC|nr:baseplate J/gp47 family protein [Bosea sp. 685]WNJ89178.1 baseplate J/gp47 family protein [Bosea sp. 685]
MPFPLPTPDEIARAQEAEMEAALRAVRPEASTLAIARAVRSEKGLVAAHVRTDALGLYETHLHLRWWGDQYMPDTAELEALIRHSSIWGVFQRPATKAVGYAQVTGLAGTVVPIGLQLRTPGGVLVETLTAVVLDGTGVGTLSLQATEGGAAANTAAGAVLPVVTVLVGLDPQSATLDDGGLAGGAAEETPGSLLARLLQVIREPGHGGADFDYPKWVQDSFAAMKVKTVPNWVGAGSVGVVVAMVEPNDDENAPPEPRVPSGAEIDAIYAHLETLRPVTAELYVLAYIPLVQAFSVKLTPDTAANRAAVTAALADHFARESEIGGTMPHSRLSEAISAANGEYSHELPVPAGDIVCAPRELAEPGAITWVPA